MRARDFRILLLRLLQFRDVLSGRLRRVDQRQLPEVHLFAARESGKHIQRPFLNSVTACGCVVGFSKNALPRLRAC